MPINPDAVGTKGEPGQAARGRRRTPSSTPSGWARAPVDPLDELTFTTENTKDVEPAGAARRWPSCSAAVAAVSSATIGDFNPAMLVHGEQAIELHRPIPVEGEVETGRRDHRHLGQGQGRGGRDAGPSSTDTETGEPLFSDSCRRSSAARVVGVATAGPSGPQNAAPDRDPDHESPTRPGPTRRCCTGCPATATRSTPTRGSPPWAGSTDRSSTGCAPTGSPAGPCSTRSAAATRPASARWRAASRRRCSPASDSTVRMWDVGRRRGAVPDHRRRRPVVLGRRPVGREDAGLGLDLLRHEHAAHGAQHRVAVEALEVAGELLDAVDLAAALDLDGHGLAVAVAAEQVDRADVGGVLAAHEAHPECEWSQLAASSSWRCASTPSFCSPGSTPSSWAESARTSRG